MLAFILSQVHHEQNLASFRFPYDTSTSSFLKATLHHEGNLTHARFPSTVKSIHHMLAHLIAHAQVHCQKQHCTMNDI